jgi:hypothetical protein
LTQYSSRSFVSGKEGEIIVKPYAQDHIFFKKKVITDINGLVAAVLVNYVLGWIDPVGVMVVGDINNSRNFIGIYYLITM